MSGAQLWNGTAEILNAKPLMMKTMPTTSMPFRFPSVKEAPMSVSKVELVEPNSRLMPYSMTAEANTPSR